MAKLFTSGPEGIKGDWDECWKRAGYSKNPGERNHHILTFITKEQNQPLEFDLTAYISSIDETTDYETIARKIRPILAQIAAGSVKATTGQVAALKLIVERGEGRITEKQREAKPASILV